MEVENKVNTETSEFRKFLQDYWIELKRYDPIIAMLTAWGVFEAPENFQVKKYFRVVLFVIQVFLAIGLTVQLSCVRDPMPEGVVVIMTIILITIPIEILNLIWFRVVKDADVMKSESEKKGCCRGCLAWTVQFTGQFLGSLLALVVFSYGTVFFVLAFAGIHPGCSETHRYALVWHVILFQFLLVPVLMSLPYWRDQGVILSVLGELGPVIGILMHLRKYGFHPPSPRLLSEKENKDVENYGA